MSSDHHSRGLCWLDRRSRERNGVTRAFQLTDTIRRRYRPYLATIEWPCCPQHPSFLYSASAAMRSPLVTGRWPQLAGGSPDFSALQDALATGRTDQLVFYAFDLLYLDGHDLRPLPLIERKAALRGRSSLLRGLCATVSILRRMAISSFVMLAAWAWKAWSRSSAMRLIDPDAAKPRRNPNAPTARNSSSLVMYHRTSTARLSAHWRSAILTAARSSMPVG